MEPHLDACDAITSRMTPRGHEIFVELTEFDGV